MYITMAVQLLYLNSLGGIKLSMLSLYTNNAKDHPENL